MSNKRYWKCAIVFDYADYGQPELGKGFHWPAGEQPGWFDHWVTAFRWRPFLNAQQWERLKRTGSTHRTRKEN